MSTPEQIRDEARDALRRTPEEDACIDWYCDSARVSNLVRWLYERDEIDISDIDSLCYFLDKPWKWDADYRRMWKETH